LSPFLFPRERSLAIFFLAHHPVGHLPIWVPETHDLRSLGVPSIYREDPEGLRIELVDLEIDLLISVVLAEGYGGSSQQRLEAPR
jgi:hypothetical protein